MSSSKKAKPQPRPIGSRPKKPSIIVYCEGTTEFNYFKYGFHIEAKDVGLARVELVNHAVNCKPEQEHVWCVFDCDHNDSKSDEQFDRAIRLAHENNFKVAYSNDSFELWFCLHYRNYATDTKTHRNEYYRELDKRMGKPNKPYDKTSKEHFTILKNDPNSNHEEAIKRAQKLHNHFQSEYPQSYHRHNPCTTVYELVAFLNKSNA